MSRRRGAAVLLALATLAPLPAPPAAADRSDDRAAIQELLDRRAEAVLARDRDAFMATTASLLRPFQRRQARLFDHLKAVPLESYALKARWEAYGDLVRPSDEARYEGAEDVAIPLTEESYRIAGFDRRAAIEDLYYTFVKRDGRWLIGNDEDLDELGLLSARHLWDVAPLYQRRTQHFLLFGQRCGRSPCDTIHATVLAAAEDALGRVDVYWRPRWARRLVILLPTSPRDLARMLQAAFDVSEFVAFAYSTIDARRDQRFTGERIIFNPAAFAGRSRSAIDTVLAHELLHVATRRSSGPLVPIFVEEGFAEYVAYGGASPSVGDPSIPADHEFVTGSPSEIYGAYKRAQSAVAFFIDRWGLEALTNFYLKLGAAHTGPGTARYHLDRAFKRTIGMGARAFEDAWASSIAR